jgi:hypothetical protein
MEREREICNGQYYENGPAHFKLVFARIFETDLAPLFPSPTLEISIGYLNVLSQLCTGTRMSNQQSLPLHAVGFSNKCTRKCK